MKFRGDAIVPTFTAFKKPNSTEIARFSNGRRDYIGRCDCMCERVRISSSVQNSCSALWDNVFVIIIDIDVVDVERRTTLRPRIRCDEGNRMDISSSGPVQSTWKRFLTDLICILWPRPRSAYIVFDDT